MFIKILRITFVAIFIIANNTYGTQLFTDHFSSIKKDGTSTIYMDDKEYLDKLKEYRYSSQTRFSYWNDLREECEPEDAVYDNVRPKDGPTLRMQYCAEQRNDTFSESSTQSSGNISIYNPPSSINLNKK